LHAIDLDELEIGLVDERGRVERMAAPLEAELSAGDSPKLVVNQRDELVQSVPVATAQ
jgi:hypothetical protein